jgi:hypothetical protein
VLKGIIHIHSTYSDGELTLRELRKMFLSAGLNFACVTDHAEYFDSRKLSEYRAQCADLSDTSFRFVAGLEYECEQQLHILGYGVTRLVATKNPQTIIRTIECESGISVIAHPRDSAFGWIEEFAFLPSGIEVWNSKYDGRYAPRPVTFRLLARLQNRRPGMLAFYGQDLHWRTQYRGLLNRVECPDTATTEEILGAFRRGNFAGTNGEFHLPSSGRLPESILHGFEHTYRRSEYVRGVIRSAKALADRAGITVPTAFKAQVRRMF